MRGREADDWLRRTAALPPADMVKRLIGANFSGIYIDRRGFADRGKALEEGLNAVLQQSPLVDDPGHLAFYLLTPTRPGRGPGAAR